MGGIGNKSIYANSPTKDKNDKEGVADLSNMYGHYTWDASNVWFSDPSNSNYKEWDEGLDEQDKGGLLHYILDYEDMQKELYEKPWDEMSTYEKGHAAELYNAINK